MPQDPEETLRAAILGTVLVADAAGDLVEPAGVRGKTLVAALALSPGSPVSVGQLADDLWADDPPHDPRAALQTLVSRLRRTVAPGLIESTAAGYRLVATARDTDLGRAEESLAQARSALGRELPAETQELTTAALGMVRGEPGADLGDSELAEVLAGRWAAVRTQLLELRVEARIRTGDGHGALADLDQLSEASTADDVRVGWRMRALDAAGRRNEALQHYAAYRHQLRASFGTDPSADLVALNARLLSADTHPGRNRTAIGLRTAPNPLLGRQQDLAALAELLRTGRLVTILGPGGLGKTRLAQEAARAATGHTPAVVFVELAGVGVGEDLALALATTLGIREVSTLTSVEELPVRLDIRERILGVLAERETLLVMDNCEHLLDGAATWIADILAATTTVRILATSRSPLSIGAEQVYLLEPLDPAEDGAAVELFTARARAARPGATLESTAVAALCTRLDGLPLAIELAAARVRSMSVEEIGRRLQDRFALLTVGERTAPRRHRTLAAVIDWSWNLLSGAEQRLLRRLSVFPDGFGPEAAQAVGGFDTGDDVANDLDGLVTQSLVTVSEEPGTGLLRYGMLETVREFGALALARSGDTEPVRSAVLAWGADYARRMLPALEGEHQIRALATFATEQENLVWLLRAGLERQDVPATLAVYAALGYYWSMSGAHTDLATFGAAVIGLTRRHVATDATRDTAILTYLLAASTYPFGNPRAGLLALGSLRRTLRGGTSSTPRIAALADLLLTSTAGILAVRTAIERYARSADPAVEGIARLFGAQLAENSGEMDAALSSARRAYDLAVGERQIWSQATASQHLAELYAQIGDTASALEWIGISRSGQAALQSHPDLQQLDWLEALTLMVAGEYDGGTSVFEDIISDDREGDDGRDGRSDDRRSLGYAGLAEAELATGNTHRGLELYRKASGPGAPALRDPWLRIVGAAAVMAHLAAGDPDPEFTRSRARRLRSVVLADLRLRPDTVDRPIIGCSLLAIGRWLIRPAAGPAEPGLLRAALELVLLAGTLGVRQTLPALNLAATLSAVQTEHPRAAVEAARGRVAGLTPAAGLDRALRLLRGPVVRTALEA
ncbi:BTAD domain-containing putative transcriptional regulator [Arthrobacter rhombi]|uniref:BTAD domain-containing putative transcriptional regulator n=1 Tax=Arthrobacter rhombi TaxID=71253 RepID=UPI0031DB599F